MMTDLKVRRRRPPTEDIIDESIEESFPASDPPAIGRSEHPGRPSLQPNPNDPPKKTGA
jgi:hypothetical protein